MFCFRCSWEQRAKNSGQVSLTPRFSEVKRLRHAH
jgi:hypothetical protein